MKNKQKNNKAIRVALGIVAIVIILGASAAIAKNTTPSGDTVQTATVQKVEKSILANGTVSSQNQATLHFQTAGKLAYLPFKEGDSVYSGQTIAQLDTTALQEQLQQALNNYRSTRDTFDQTQQNANNGVLQGQQKSQNLGGISGQPQTDIINSTIKTIVDQNQANLDNSVIAVQLATYAEQLATLTAPFNGVILQEDVTTPFVNVTPATSFVVADPSNLVFKANISESDINFVDVGSPAKIILSGSNTSYDGTITKIYPQKVTLPSGESVYQVDISSSSLTSQGRLGQAGSVLIQNKFDQSVVLINSWMVLQNQYVWVMENNKPVLKKIRVGDSVGDKVEVLGGLSENDKLITNPKAVIQNKYLPLSI